MHNLTALRIKSSFLIEFNVLTPFYIKHYPLTNDTRLQYNTTFTLLQHS